MEHRTRIAPLFRGHVLAAILTKAIIALHRNFKSAVTGTEIGCVDPRDNCC